MRALHRCLALACALTPLAGLAHTPAKLDPASTFVVPNPKVSWAIFGLFETGEERFVIELSFDERFATPIELLVPHQSQLSGHRPAFAIVGPGLPAPSAEELSALPSPLPEGWGAVVELNTASPREVLFESIMRRFYWTSGSTAVVFPKGTLQLWAWSPQRTTGKFVVAFGVEEGGGYLAALEDWCFYEY